VVVVANLTFARPILETSSYVADEAQPAWTSTIGFAGCRTSWSRGAGRGGGVADELADPVGRVRYLISPTGGATRGALNAVLAIHAGGDWK